MLHARCMGCLVCGFSFEGIGSCPACGSDAQHTENIVESTSESLVEKKEKDDSVTFMGNYPEAHSDESLEQSIDNTPSIPYGIDDAPIIHSIPDNLPYGVDYAPIYE